MGVPIGGVVAWPSGASVPSGYLACDGSAVSRATYAALFGAIGTTNGAGDGSTTFNVPDLTSRFVPGAGGADAPADTGGNNGWVPGPHVHDPSTPSGTGSNHVHDGPAPWGAPGVGTWTGVTQSTTPSAKPIGGGTVITLAHTVEGVGSHQHAVTDGVIRNGTPHHHDTSGQYASADPAGLDQTPPWFAVTFIVRAS